MEGQPYRVPDGSLVTELVRPEHGGSRNLSVARARVMPGQSTLTHYHRLSEEVYYVLEGSGLLRIDGRQIEIAPGDARLIRPGQRHSVTCSGSTALTILCLCAPAYQHDDTAVVEQVAV